MSANSGGGTDHGWSGVSMMLGGSLDGGRILGEYPDDLTSDSPLDIGKLQGFTQSLFLHNSNMFFIK